MREVTIIFVLIMTTFVCIVFGVPFLFVTSVTLSMDHYAQKFVEHRREMRQLERSVEGEVAFVEILTKTYEDKPDVSIKFNVKEEEKPKFVEKKLYVIHFADGREKSFEVVPPKPIEAGKYYIIDYNGLGEIISVQTKE